MVNVVIPENESATSACCWIISNHFEFDRLVVAIARDILFTTEIIFSCFMNKAIHLMINFAQRSYDKADVSNVDSFDCC